MARKSQPSRSVWPDMPMPALFEPKASPEDSGPDVAPILSHMQDNRTGLRRLLKKENLIGAGVLVANLLLGFPSIYAGIPLALSARNFVKERSRVERSGERRGTVKGILYATRSLAFAALGALVGAPIPGEWATYLGSTAGAVIDTIRVESKQREALRQQEQRLEYDLQKTEFTALMRRLHPNSQPQGRRLVNALMPEITFPEFFGDTDPQQYWHQLVRENVGPGRLPVEEFLEDLRALELVLRGLSGSFTPDFENTAVQTACQSDDAKAFVLQSIRGMPHEQAVLTELLGQEFDTDVSSDDFQKYCLQAGRMNEAWRQYPRLQEQYYRTLTRRPEFAQYTQEWFRHKPNEANRLLQSSDTMSRFIWPQITKDPQTRSNFEAFIGQRYRDDVLEAEFIGRVKLDSLVAKLSQDPADEIEFLAQYDTEYPNALAEWYIHQPEAANQALASEEARPVLARLLLRLPGGAQQAVKLTGSRYRSEIPETEFAGLAQLEQVRDVVQGDAALRDQYLQTFDSEYSHLVWYEERPEAASKVLVSSDGRKKVKAGISEGQKAQLLDPSTEQFRDSASDAAVDKKFRENPNLANQFIAAQGAWTEQFPKAVAAALISPEAQAFAQRETETRAPSGVKVQPLTPQKVATFFEKYPALQEQYLRTVPTATIMQLCLEQGCFHSTVAKGFLYNQLSPQERIALCGNNLTIEGIEDHVLLEFLDKAANRSLRENVLQNSPVPSDCQEWWQRRPGDIDIKFNNRRRLLTFAAAQLNDRQKVEVCGFMYGDDDNLRQELEQLDGEAVVKFLNGRQSLRTSILQQLPRPVQFASWSDVLPQEKQRRLRNKAELAKFLHAKLTPQERVEVIGEAQYGGVAELRNVFQGLLPAKVLEFLDQYPDLKETCLRAIPIPQEFQNWWDVAPEAVMQRVQSSSDAIGFLYIQLSPQQRVELLDKQYGDLEDMRGLFEGSSSPEVLGRLLTYFKRNPRLAHAFFQTPEGELLIYEKLIEFAKELRNQGFDTMAFFKRAAFEGADVAVSSIAGRVLPEPFQTVFNAGMGAWRLFRDNQAGRRGVSRGRPLSPPPAQ